MKNIVFVDDSEEILNFFRVMMKKNIDHVKLFLDADQAFNYLSGLSIEERKKIQIVSDIKMPDKNGIEFLEDLIDAKIEVGFVFYSAYVESSDISKFEEFGFYKGFVKKPDFKDLRKFFND